MSVIPTDILLNQYIPFNRSVPYKDWLISPIKIEDWYNVREALGLLQIDKNTLGEIQFISMNNLQFILTTLSFEEYYIDSFVNLLNLALDIKENEVIQFAINDDDAFLNIGELIKETEVMSDNYRTITSEDFDEIRRIILYQNVLDYTDKYIDPDVKREVDEYYRLKNKGAKEISIEHKTICIQLRTGMSTELIGKLTIRNFLLLFDSIVEESDYQAMKLAEANGAKFKSPIEHWAYRSDKDKYADAFCDADAFADKMQNAN